MEIKVGDKFLIKDNYTVLNCMKTDQETTVFMPFYSNLLLVGPTTNTKGLLEGATKLSSDDWKRRMVAFCAWEGTKDQDDQQPENYMTDFDSFWKDAPMKTVDSFFDMQSIQKIIEEVDISGLEGVPDGITQH